MKRIIALTGPKGVGKTTFAKKVQSETKVLGTIEILSFAGPLKAMLRTLLPPEAYTPEGKEDLRYGLCGKTPRHLMQTLGTEWGRNLIGEDVWVEAVRNQILTSDADTIIIDDLRFQNEAEMVRALGGEVWSVSRGGIDYSGEHASESPIPNSLVSGAIRLGKDAHTGKKNADWVPGIDRDGARG
jgi:hypothetical protein